MSVVSAVNCPLCGRRKAMQEDYSWKCDEVFYHCHSCGFGNLFHLVEEADGDAHARWDKRYERSRFGRHVKIARRHGLLFIGSAFFYPIGADFEGDYSVQTRSKGRNLVWKLYSAEAKLLGEFRSLGEAFRAGDKHADGCEHA